MKKKLMMTMAVAAAAAVVNAAAVTWGASKGYLYEAGGANKLKSGTAYLMFATSAFDQNALVSAFDAANGDSSATLAAMTGSGALATGTGTVGSNARIASTESTYALTDSGSAYFVVFDGDKMYVSAAQDAAYDPVTDSVEIIFNVMTTSSKNAALSSAGGYSGAGWYAAPEPTSGLLMLMGFAGLALRRRRA